MLNILLIAAGGAIGSVARYLLSTATLNLLNKNFPYGILVVNILGCFLAGIISILLIERFYHLASELRSLLIIGFLGGFTTFSSFSLETINLVENGQTVAASINIVSSILLCLMGTWAGIWLGRQL